MAESEGFDFYRIFQMAYASVVNVYAVLACRFVLGYIDLYNFKLTQLVVMW
jgi:hypothetical protein